MFVEGGHLVMARALVQALREEGHAAELVVTPQNRFGRQGAAYLAAWLTDVGLGHNNRPIDQVISLRYPSYAVRHPNHVVWLNHTMREYYDQWDAFSAPLRWKGRLKELTRRQLIRWTDRRLLTRHVRKVFTISQTVSGRLTRFGGIRSEPLYPPPPQRAYRCEGYERLCFCDLAACTLETAVTAHRGARESRSGRHQMRHRRRGRRASGARTRDRHPRAFHRASS